MNKMLISVSQSDEVRVALVQENTLYDLDIEQPGFEQKKANIYKGKVSRIEPSLAAAFVDYGANRHGFLPFKEVARSYFKPEHANEPFSKLGIKEALKEGQEILVQIDKEERGSKGAALTTFISLAGSYLVLIPNNPRVGGVSRRIEGKERDDLREILHELKVPEGMGLIVRTAGVGRSSSDLKWDLESLLKRWNTIESTAAENKAPILIHQEGDAVMRAIRDYLRQDMTEILVDSPDLFEKTKEYIKQVKPEFSSKVKLYQEKIPLFSYYQIEKQIETAYQRVVKLPSGGSISIDHTEALISIDINSAKATSGSNIEETALNTNLEAAEEIARQLRLRDIGGLIVIDFIDMTHTKHQREVSHKLREALEHDRARVQVGHITRFGLLEMSRQRLRTHLGSAIQVPCPRCDGQGTIRSIESLSSSIIRLIEEEAIKKDTGEVRVQLPIDLATFMLNERREVIFEISKRQGIGITILPNQYLDTPQYKVNRIRSREIPKNKEASYKLVEEQQPELPKIKEATPTKKPETPAAAKKAEKKSSGFSLFGFIKRLFTSKKIKKEEHKGKKPYRRTPSSRGPYKSTRPRGKQQTQTSRGSGGKYRKSGSSDRRSTTRKRSSKPEQRSNIQKRTYEGKNNPPPLTDSYHEMTLEKIKGDFPSENKVTKKSHVEKPQEKPTTQLNEKPVEKVETNKFETKTSFDKKDTNISDKIKNTADINLEKTNDSNISE